MNCLVCDNQIRIDSVGQLFAFSPLLLCGKCAPFLVPSSGVPLFEGNPWMTEVIKRLDKGDLALIQLFEPAFRKAFKRLGIGIDEVTVVGDFEALPYPWLQILTEKTAGPRGAVVPEKGKYLVAVRILDCPDASVSLV